MATDLQIKNNTSVVSKLQVHRIGGATEQICILKCNDTIAWEQHDYIIDSSATCTTAGTKHCSRCLKEGTISALGHDWYNPQPATTAQDSGTTERCRNDSSHTRSVSKTLGGVVFDEYPTSITVEHSNGQIYAYSRTSSSQIVGTGRKYVAEGGGTFTNGAVQLTYRHSGYSTNKGVPTRPQISYTSDLDQYISFSLSLPSLGNGPIGYDITITITGCDEPYLHKTYGIYN